MAKLSCEHGVLDSQCEVCELIAERDDLQATFDLRWKADMRAILRWQADTGKDMAWPDHADLCVWLMQKVDGLETFTTAYDKWASSRGVYPIGDINFFFAMLEARDKVD